MRTWWISHRRDGISDHVALRAESDQAALELARHAGYEPLLVVGPPPGLEDALPVLELEAEERPLPFEVLE